ncbi:MAG: cysteine synthase A [Caldiserica bacterium]|nr:cysteine synthase A [Caldisericota bacterium]
MPVKILVNGKAEELESGLSIAEFLKRKKIRPEVVTVELNDKIIPREDYEKVNLENDDRLEIVFFMGGGGLDERKEKKCGVKVANSVLELIFNTPIVKLNRLVDDKMAEVYAKLESFTPGGSVKDRIALSMIEDAERKGRIKPGSIIVEPTSGNTGIGLAFVCAVKGYKCILTMPESMSLERMYILKSFGAETVLTPAIEGMEGAVKKAEEIVEETENAFMPQQFKNPANPEIHRKTTAQEIINCMDGELDAFVAGIGTGGTITGVGGALKEKYPQIQVVGVEPDSSAVLSGKAPGPHKIQGIGPGFIPEVLDREVIDRIISVTDEDAYHTAQRLAKEEGVFCGISSGAACFAALEVAKDLGKGKKVLVILPDTGERYFSMQQYFEI